MFVSIVFLYNCDFHYCRIASIHASSFRFESQASEAIEDARDPETYDDAEFYQTLLKEFLEGKNVDSGSTGGSWYSSTKRRRLVDRRASKGRKIRYHIHEKLVNFMTPIELHAPQFAPNVFANLFGRGSSA